MIMASLKTLRFQRSGAKLYIAEAPPHSSFWICVSMKLSWFHLSGGVLSLRAPFEKQECAGFL